MQSPGIVKPIDEPADRDLALLAGAKPMSIQQLGLQRGEKRLRHGIVIAVADAAHRAFDAKAPAALAKRPRGVLTALIGMMDQGSGHGPIARRMLQRLHHQLRGMRHADPVADHAPRMHIQHDGQIHRALQGVDMRRIGHPQLVGALRGELASNHVRCLDRSILGLRETALGTPGAASEPTLAHQPDNPAKADNVTAMEQLDAHATGSVRPSHLFLNGAHTLDQTAVFRLAPQALLGIAQPAVETASENDPAHAPCQ